jgi:dUTPase
MSIYDVNYLLLIREPDLELPDRRTLRQAYEDQIKAHNTENRGFDLIVPRDTIIPYDSLGNKIDHHVSFVALCNDVEIGPDLRLRSGTTKTAYRLANGVGTIDIYRGPYIAAIDSFDSMHSPSIRALQFRRQLRSLLEEADDLYPSRTELLLMLDLYNSDEDNKEDSGTLIKAGTRLVQIVNPLGGRTTVQIVESLPASTRGEKGFGSSGGI